jgi:WD40 repeat protein
VLAADGQVQATSASPLSGIGQVAVSPDSSRLVAACGLGHATWSLPDLTPVSVVRGPSLRSVAIHPSGRLFATTNLSGRIEVWSLQSNRQETTIQTAIQTGVGQVAVEFSAEGEHLLALKPTALGLGFPALVNFPKLWSHSRVPEAWHGCQDADFVSPRIDAVP